MLGGEPERALGGEPGSDDDAGLLLGASESSNLEPGSVVETGKAACA